MEVGTSIEFSKRFYNVLWLGSTISSFFKYDLATGNFKQYNFDSKNVNSPKQFISVSFLRIVKVSSGLQHQTVY